MKTLNNIDRAERIDSSKGHTLSDIKKGDVILLGERQSFGGERIIKATESKVAKVGKGSIKLENGLTLKIWDYNGSLYNYWDDYSKNAVNVCNITGAKFSADIIILYRGGSVFNDMLKQAIEYRDHKAYKQRVADAKVEAKAEYNKIVEDLEWELHRKKTELWEQTVCSKCKNYNAETKSCMTRYAEYEGKAVTVQEQSYTVYGCSDFELITEVE